MATRATVRARVRRELGDVGAVQTWKDDQLNDHVGDALSELGRVVPRSPVVATLVPVVAQRQYSVGAAFVDVLGVEFPAGTWLPRSAGLVPGEGTPDAEEGSYQNEYSVDVEGGTVRLLLSPTDTAERIRVHYRPLVAVPSDDVTVLGIESDEDALVALMACETLWDQRHAQEARRGNRSTGNPYARRVRAMVARRQRARMASLVDGPLPVAGSAGS